METRKGSTGWKAASIWLGGFVAFALFVILNKDLATFLRYLLLGLPQGAVIALIAVGYSMVYGIIQLINFAHGEVFMFATYFVLMFLVAPETPDAVGPHLITAFVALLVWCALWVALEPWGRARLSGGAGEERSRGRGLVRAGLATTGAVLVAGLVLALLPKYGGKPVVPFFVAYALAIGFAACLGVTMDLLAYRPLRASPRLIPLITAIGLSLFLQNIAQATWGSASRFFPADVTPAVFSGKRVPIVRIGDTQLDMSLLDALILVLAVSLMVIVQLFILRTRAGMAMRACAQDRTTAALMGIHVDRFVALAFALGAGLAAVVAPLYVLRGSPIYPQMGYIVGILAFASAVLGGIGNITGAMLGGMIIGIIYSFVPLFDAFDTFRIFGWLEEMGWITRAGYERFVTEFGRPGQYQLGVAYAFMILVIVFKPTGLLGKTSAKRA
ncbi:MAG: branched-chain amino acid ABC transporter permease [Candidatus Sumerlaea chitinivorans]|nr:branched-chain amino acid ABC transporter permease [Candidatus Sumerlaea chitinivorans]